jgi:radical SAM protein with 4Fe4S-binding SPASM domain
LLQNTGVKVINIHTKMLGVSLPDRPYQKCRASSWYIFVGPDGTVYNCVELGLDTSVAIGNLLVQSLDEIWHNQRRHEVMDFIDNSGLNTLCPPICLYYELNSLFEKLDHAFQIGGVQRQTILEWIEAQESRIQSEISTSGVSQAHIEFI